MRVRWVDNAVKPRCRKRARHTLYRRVELFTIDVYCVPAALTGLEEVIYYANVTRRQNGKDSSRFLDSIPLASGNEGGSDLGHYCAEIITLRLRVSSMGGVFGSVSIILGEGAQLGRFG